MKNSYRAEDVFREFPKDLKTKIFDTAAGKLVYFPKKNIKKAPIDSEIVLIQYAKNNKSYSQIGNKLNVSKVRICQIINRERKNFSKDRVEYWLKQDLSLREIARLFKKSHETVRNNLGK